jgi:hypothetical protein
MKTKSFAPKTPVQSDYSAPRQTIGFKPVSSLPAVVDITPEPEDRLEGGYTEMELLVLEVARRYFEKRSNNCFVEGADKELIEKMEKVWVKYYDTII